MTTIDATDARLSSHEEVCALRYEVINARLKRLESILVTACGVLLTGMGGVVMTLITHAR
ncbi:hypothetical protein UFOVP128_22 [uncultured Caudovirales phage]|uniref:Uncharacterized protein n=1 Tax=uncultured Caudovirales phage TaxID=2100421 RepID=A0A6J7X445_9CAUD|nr:hypothetical protein UFOVP128_22 [uncultured Caudovirales phage]CAB5222053.1 hypothetical protein UFOVP243_22 [uncultured Caudovirales phage]